MATRFTDHLLTGDHASRPAFGSVPQGTLYACSDHDLIYQSDGSTAWSTWADVSGGAGGIPATIFDAAGDLLYASAADTAARLAAGSAGTILTSGGVASPVWTAPPQAAAYKRATGDYTTTSATFVDIDGTNMALTFTTRARRVLLGFSGSIYCSATSTVAMDFMVDGARVGGDFGLQVWNVNHAGNALPVGFTFLTDVLTAASHTFKVQWLSTAGSTATIMGAATGGAWAQFYAVEQGS